VVGCSIWNAETYGDCVFQLFYTIILAPAALILGIAGALLNFVIETTIIGFADFVKGTSDGAAGAISLAWGLIRDALNMTFIFILLYTGLRTILGVGNYQTVLPKIVLAGLLINFSFFFTSVLIDISNVATVELHNAIQKIGDAETVEAGTGSLIEFSGISGAFMSGLELRVQDGANPAQKFVMAIMSFVVMIVAAFVFFVMAAMLVVRYIILIILLITSSVAVMGGLLPQLDSKKWWVPFTAQLTFPVLFMLFELIVILIINSTGFKEAIRGDYTDTSFFGQVAGALLGYALVLGLMVAGLIVAKQTAGAAGAGFTNWASKKAGSLAFGGVAAAGAHSFGRLGKMAAESSYVNRLKGSDNVFAQKFGSRLSAAGTAVGSASFDVRGIDAIGKKAGAGKAAGGFIQRAKQVEKEKKDAGEQIKKNVERDAKKDFAEKEQNEVKQLEAKLAGLRSKMESKISPTLTIDERGRVINKAVEQGTTLDARQYKEAQDRLNALKAAKPEETVRKEAADAAKNVTAADISHVDAVLNSKDIKEEQNLDKQRNMILQRLDANERKYYEATQQLLALEKRKVAQERIYKSQWATGAAASTSKAERDVADKMRKELNKDKKSRAWEEIEKVIREEKVIDEEGGGKEGKKEENKEDGETKQDETKQTP
jgi:hypothetical protein